jgi:hypothetical protein
MRKARAISQIKNSRWPYTTTLFQQLSCEQLTPLVSISMVTC